MDTRDKISFSLPKTLEAKEEHIREQTISISCCFSTNPLFSQNRNAYCFEDFVVARECASVGSIERSHRGRVCALSKRTREASSSRALEEERRVLQPNCRQKKQKKSISLLRTANKDIACLRSTVSSLDAKVTFEVRETDFTERCRFKLSVLVTDAFALMWMDWTIEAIIISIYFCVLL